MVSVRSVLLGGALVLALVLECEANYSVRLKLDDKVKTFVEEWAASKRTRVASWHLDGDLPKHEQVTLSACCISYYKARKSTTKPNAIYTEWIHNDSPDHTKSIITRKAAHTRTHSWTTEKAISDRSFGLYVKTKFSFVDTDREITMNMPLHYCATKWVKETEEFSVNQEIIVPPLSSVKVEWILTDIVQEIPWKADAEVRGWFGARLKEKYRGSLDRLWMICQISDPLLQSDCSTVHHDGGRVKFTPEGVLVGVTNTESHLNISRHDLNAYGSKPLSVEIVKLPRH